MPPRAVLRTARLRLRPVAARDEAAVVAALSRPEVAGWLARVPARYAAEHFRDWLPTAGAGVWAVEDAAGLAGVISVAPHLGYWFAPDRWGRGYATEAGRAAVAEHFADKATGELSSGYFAGNGASARVLQKLGFAEFGDRAIEQAATGRKRRHVDMVLTRAAFARANPFRVETDRLLLAPPDPDRDLEVFLAIFGQHGVARNLGSYVHPLTAEQARARLKAAAWAGHLGFTLGLYLKADGRFAGTVGVGGDPASAGYALAPDLWGRGLMREALCAFLAEVFARFDLASVEADHFADNPASGRVLAAVGFEKAREGLGRSKARLEPHPVIKYRLQRNHLKA